MPEPTMSLENPVKLGFLDPQYKRVNSGMPEGVYRLYALNPVKGSVIHSGMNRYTIKGKIYYNDLLQDQVKLRLHDRLTGNVLSETISDVNGNYDFNYPVLAGYKYYIIAFDKNSEPILNAKIKDYMDPILIT